MIVVSFILQKLLAHHHTSGRNSAQFNIGELFNQLGSGKLAPNMTRHSIMVKDLSRVAGMDQAPLRRAETRLSRWWTIGP